MENNTNYKISRAVAGLNNDNVLSQLKEGQLTFAKNAVVENFDGSKVTYQNEQSNIKCLDIKEGYVVIGEHNIIEQNKTILFLTNPSTGDSEIGARNNLTCEYTPIVYGACLNLNKGYPIPKVIVKTTNCSTQIFWTDGYNPRRWMDLEDLPWREIPDPNNDSKKIKIVGDLDCNKLLVQPNFSVTRITPIDTDTGGSLLTGSYQFAIQYANSLGEGYTSFYGFTNAVGIFDDKVTPNFGTQTTKSIVIKIEGLDTSGLYDYFNIVAIKTINGTTSFDLIDTLPVNTDTLTYTYTGNTKGVIQLSENDIIERFPYYDIAQDIAATDNSLMWVDLSTAQKRSMQKMWNKVILKFCEYKLPVNDFESYNNPINTSEYRGYLRDEVYVFLGVPVYKDGRLGEAYPIPGPAITAYDQEVITNKDTAQQKTDPCEESTPKARWEVYNTAKVEGFTDEYLTAGGETCYKGSYRYGSFGYWQSSLNYPNNVEIWGDLAGTPIRHHKMPDCLVSPIHDEEFIYPLGVMIDAASLYNALGELTQEERDNIAGFKIVRANRAGNQSIIAKGILYNIGSYIREGQKYFYPNYPLNDLRPDPLIANSPVLHHSGVNSDKWLDGFTDPLIRYSFLSPDTTFVQPFGINTGYLKLETVEYGKSQGHFVEVKDNAKYKFLTNRAIYLAFAAAMSSIVSLDTGGGILGVAPSVTLNLEAIPATFSAMLDILKNIAPAINYGWQFNSVGKYTNSVGVPNDGNKVRTIIDGAYLSSNYESVGGENINNYQRESSVYLKLADELPKPEFFGVPQDQSRYTIQDCNAPGNYTERNISSYYGAIKRVFPDQYGRINSFEIIDTGYYQPINFNTPLLTLPIVFGGDTFINRFGVKRKLPFFLDNTVGKDNQSDIALNLLGNIGYPIYFYGTNQIDATINLDGVDNLITILTDFDFGTIASNIISGGTRPLIAGLGIMLRIFRGYLDVLGVNNVNLDCYTTDNLNEIGKAYLFAYGISYFYTESSINVDYRQATNDNEGNFYPNVGTAIPDDWLQETRVSIIQDNKYTYDISYSKQIKEINFVTLREDYDPTKTCLFDFPNRLIYSEQSNLEETKNNWLVYRPLSKVELPKNYGLVTAIDGLEDRKLLVRFENKSLLYNVYQTVQTSTGTAYQGNPNLFSTPPLDFAETDIGYNGSQHKFIVKTEYGHITVDSERGQVFLYRGNQINDISSNGLEKWFCDNLEFKIRQTFPTAKIDNAYNGIGLCGAYDNKHSRLLLTKRDYIPLLTDIKYDSELDQYTYNNNVISLDDETYFCNVSWTLSYSFLTQSWISFHSYIPNYYIAASGTYDTGINYSINNQLPSIWRHNTGVKFQSVYGKIEDYVLEYPMYYFPNQEIVGSITDATQVLQYANSDVYAEPNTDMWFNRAVIYNNAQCTGYLELIPKPIGDMSAYFRYPLITTSNKTILYSRKDGSYSFNTFWDIVKTPGLPFYRRPCNIPSLDKVFDANLDYTKNGGQSSRIRNRECRIRLIHNLTDAYKFRSDFIITESQKSTT